MSKKLAKPVLLKEVRPQVLHEPESIFLDSVDATDPKQDF